MLGQSFMLVVDTQLTFGDRIGHAVDLCREKLFFYM